MTTNARNVLGIAFGMLAMLSGPAALAATDCQQKLDTAVAAMSASGPVRLTDEFILLGKVSSEFIVEHAPPDRYRVLVNVPGLPNMPEVKWTRIGRDGYVPGEPVDTTSYNDESAAAYWRREMPLYDPMLMTALSCNGAVIEFQQESIARNAEGREILLEMMKGGIVQTGRLTFDAASGRAILIERYELVDPSAPQESGEKTVQHRIRIDYDPSIKIEPPR
jgi:hypothetical protein